MVERLLHEDGKTLIQYEHDAEPAFEAIKRARLEGNVWERGMKADAKMMHAFHIPVGVVMELRGIGVDVYTDPLKDIVSGLTRLNRYDACRMTDRTVV